MAKTKGKKKVTKKTVAKKVPDLNPKQKYLAAYKKFSDNQKAYFRKMFPR